MGSEDAVADYTQVTSRLLVQVSTRRLLWLLLAALTLSGGTVAAHAPTPPLAVIQNDEGGPVSISGVVTYTNAYFTTGVAAPMIILEDQAGFIDRDQGFLLPKASQTLGQITSSFLTSPFSYSLALPIVPQASVRDVDHDGENDPGIMVFAVAYWTNKFGDPFLEERDLFGGGWSTAYASTRVSANITTIREIIGGKLVVFATAPNQGFPSGFGPDMRLFTADDPLVRLPSGYTVVDLDTNPFTFDRSKHAVIDLYEPEQAAQADFSGLNYPAAFAALIEKLRREYAFTEYKKLDWEMLKNRYMPRFVDAQNRQNRLEYLRTLRDFTLEIPDGHVKGPRISLDYIRETSGGIGLAVGETDDARVFVIYVDNDGPGAAAGIAYGAEIVAVNTIPILQFLDQVEPWSGPFSTAHKRRQDQLRFALRAPVGTELTITYRNPGAAQPDVASLRAVAESASLRVTAPSAGTTGFELPLEYELLEDDLAYVKIYSFFDNDLLTVQLWERLMRTLTQRAVGGLIIDLRQNSGGNGFLADQMAAYFFDTPLELGNTGHYNYELDQFYFDPRTVDRYYLPPVEFRYRGQIAILVGPHCSSACEFFAYDLTLQDRAVIIGHTPTAGLGGSVTQLLMPEHEPFQFTVGRAVDPQGNIHIEGQGVAPDIQVPITSEVLLSATDAVLQAAIEYLTGD